MKLLKLSIVAAATASCFIATAAHALKSEDRDIKANYIVDYTKVPGEVESFMDMFSEGHMYGRLRSSNILFNWVESNPAGVGGSQGIAGGPAAIPGGGGAGAASGNRDTRIQGVGGSFVFKTGSYKGFTSTIGYYGLTPLTKSTVDGAGGRFNARNSNLMRTRRDGTSAGINTFAEANINYHVGKTDVKVGRQIIEGNLLATNDAFIIPQVFEAIIVENKDLPDTKVRLGLVTGQKHRDHQEFHTLIAVGDFDNRGGATGISGSGTQASPLVVNAANNPRRDRTAFEDDGGRHAGLTLANIAKAKNAGSAATFNPAMLYSTAENKSVSNLQLNGEFIGLQGFFNTAMFEGNYKADLGAGWTLTPGIRYINQMDAGAGAIGGASLTGRATTDANQANRGSNDVALSRTMVVSSGTAAANATAQSNGRANARAAQLGRDSYTAAENVDAHLTMARLVLAKGPLGVSLARSQVGNKADIIAPWRGFPTRDYTRAMGMVNWNANTATNMLRVDFDFGKAELVPGLKAAVAYTTMDYDDNKVMVGTVAFTDRNHQFLDIIKEFKSLPNMDFRLRVANIMAKTGYDLRTTVSSTGVAVTDGNGAAIGSGALQSKNYESFYETRFEINYLF